MCIPYPSPYFPPHTMGGGTVNTGHDTIYMYLLSHVVRYIERTTAPHPLCTAASSAAQRMSGLITLSRSCIVRGTPDGSICCILTEVAAC